MRFGLADQTPALFSVWSQAHHPPIADGGTNATGRVPRFVVQPFHATFRSGTSRTARVHMHRRTTNAHRRMEPCLQRFEQCVFEQRSRHLTQIINHLVCRLIDKLIIATQLFIQPMPLFKDVTVLQTKNESQS